jgi:ABC-type Fe3+ transport system permease subunit
MAYCAWTLLRAPRTPLGDWLADAPAWVSDWAGPVFGVWGMTLWSWPLAALVIGAAARRIDQSLLDVLELEGASRGRRLLVVARMLCPGLLAAVLLVMMVMMGSMVALDVSRLVTYSVVLLRWTNEHPSDVPVWRASWPLAIVALGATLVLLRLTGAESGSTGLEMPSQGSGRRRWGLLGWTLLVWGLSVAVPGVLFLLSLREPPHAATLATIRQFVWGFWHNTGGAVWSSVGEAARVGAVALVVSGCAWYGASRGRGSRRLMALS